MICNISDKHIAMVETKKCSDCVHLHMMNWKSKSVYHKCDIDNCMANPKSDACLLFKAGENQ